MRLDRRLDAELVARQDGVVTRRQVLACGLTDAAVTAHLRSGRWQRLHDGVFLASPVPASFRQRVWGGVLAAGPGAAASHATAAALLGLLPESDGPVTVSVVQARQPRRRTGLVVRRRRRLTTVPGASPPCTSPVDTVLDLVADCRDPGDVVGMLTRCVDRAGVTAPAVRAALVERPMQTWRALLLEVTAATGDGVRSPLEHRYRRDVELAHGLPTPTRQSSRRSDRGRYVRDLEYDLWQLLVELDGRLNHADTDRVFRDMQRDNAATLTQRATLRYGWADVAGRPCRVAAQVAQALEQRGWAGWPRRCGAGCTLR
jgi:hypothetical protein